MVYDAQIAPEGQAGGKGGMAWAEAEAAPKYRRPTTREGRRGVQILLGEGTLVERFLRQVRLDEATGCWRWQGLVSRGRTPIWSAHGKPQSALRLSWELFVGGVRAGQAIVRICGDKRCVRPDHLAIHGQEPSKKARKSPFRKLSAEKILEIRCSQDSKSVLAKRYDVSEWTIWAIKRGKRGKLLTIAVEPDEQMQRQMELKEEIQKLSERIKQAVTL